MTSLFDYDERSVESRRWRAGFGLVVSLLLVAVGCGREVGQRELDPPVALIGIDGLEWRVMLPMIREGRLPNMTRLMERGSFGRLRTMVPTLSPMIWTSVATGKGAPKHGINHFVSKGPDSSVHLLTNRDRTTKAIWNIFSDFDRTVHCIGWWMTFPAEEVNGTMVAQTNTTGQIKTARGNAIWKGAVLPGLDGQVYPVADQARVMDLAEEVQKELKAAKV